MQTEKTDSELKLEYAALIATGHSDKQALIKLGRERGQDCLKNRQLDFTDAETRQKIAELTRNRMSSAMAPLAVQTLFDIMQDEDAHPKNRIAAAVAILDRAGYAPATGKNAQGDGKKSLADMSSNELAATVERARSELARRADNAKPAETIPPNTVNMFD